MWQSVLEAGISNVVVASVMALVVFAVTRFWKNPHIAHILWLLVLVKLVTPPLWHIPISLPPVLANFTWSGDKSTRNENRIVSSGLEAAESASWERATPSSDEHRRIRVNVKRYGSLPELAAERSRVHSTVDPNTASHKPIREGFSAPDQASWWLATTAVLWMGGSLVWITVFSVRLVYFNRLLSQTLPATAKMKRTAKMIAENLSLRRLPNLRLTEAVVSPMVWPAAYRPMVVLPKQLVDEMDSEQLSVVVAHEFGHLQRGDHWVRFLEFVVVSLCWWKPVVWWMRRELHAAEEACCDALVLRMYPDSAAAYGNALLHTNEFVMSGQVPSPVLASGFGHSCSLKRRVEMILKNEFGKPASRIVRLMLAAIAVGVLPMAARVTLAQTKTTEIVAENAATEDSLAQKAGQSLEQRVDRIEKLLKQLIKAQERNNPTVAQFGILRNLTTPGNPATAAYEEAFADAKAFAGAKARADIKVFADAQKVLALRRYEAAAALQAGESRLRIKVNGEVFLSIKAVENSLAKKQADIQRLSKEIDQLKEALTRTQTQTAPNGVRRR